MRSTGNNGTAGSAGVSGALLGIAGRLMKLRATLDTQTCAGNLRFENLATPRPISRFPMQRILQPELLDSLPHDHPDALHNRRDLRLTNRILGNHRWLTRTLPPLLREGELTLEIGAGTGELGLSLARAGANVDALDMWPSPPEWPASRAWHRCDLREFSGYDAYAAIVGNLIFHQFSDNDLAVLGEKIHRTARIVIACEPVRRRSSQAMFRTFAPLLGANHVSLHDAHVSIAAGFRADELPRALGLTPEAWDVRCSVTLLGVYRMLATRRTSRA